MHKTWPVSLVIRTTQIKITIIYQYTPIRMTKNFFKFWQYQVLAIRRTIRTFIHRWLQCQIQPATLEYSLAISCRVKHILTMRTSSSLPGICPKTMKMYKHTHVSCSPQTCTQMLNSRIVHNYQNLERTQMSFTLWMDEQMVVHPYNGLWLSDKKNDLEIGITCNHRDIICIIIRERSQTPYSICMIAFVSQKAKV